MARPKSGKQTISINFDIEVLRALEVRCKKDGTKISSFVNAITRNVVINEYEYYREKAKHHNSEFQKYKFLMDTSPDNPDRIKQREVI